MRKAFSKIRENNCDVEKQVEVGWFFTGIVHSNLKTSKKDCGAQLKTVEAVPQEGTDHQWDLGPYLSLEF